MVLPNFNYEKKLWRMKFEYIGGIDEVGRGCFAGPVVAGVVVFRAGPEFRSPVLDAWGNEVFINDSKKLTPDRRKKASVWIKKNALCWGVGEASSFLINRTGIVKATRVAMRRAVASANQKLLDKNIEYLLLDAFYLPFIRGLPKNRDKKIKGVKRQKDGFSVINSKSKQLAIIKGDQKSLSIAAGSIIAKVYRDSLMERIGKRSFYRKYDWVNNKGYASKKHREAIRKYGITKYHRKQFVRTYLNNFFSSRAQ